METWKSGKLVKNKLDIWKFANLEIWEFEFVLYVAAKVWMSRFPDFFGQTFQISRMNLEICKSGNLVLKIWNFGNLEI